MSDEEKVYKPVRRARIPFTPKIVIVVLVILFLVAAAASSFFVVDQREQAVVLRFGKYDRTVGPGLHARLPFGLERSHTVATQLVQTLTFGYRSTDTTGTGLAGARSYDDESVMLTGDLNIVDVEWIVQYRINDPYKWLFSVEEKEKTIRDISQSVMNALVGDLPILSVMTDLRTKIEVEAQQQMQAIFDGYDFGIEVVTVKLQNIVPPEGAVQDAFEDVNKAIQDMNKSINEGKEYYNTAIPEAQGEATRIVLEAEGYAAQRVNQAKGDVAVFDSMRASYEASPEVTATRLHLEAMEEVLSSDGGSITLVDPALDNFLPVRNIGGAK